MFLRPSTIVLSLLAFSGSIIASAVPKRAASEVVTKAMVTVVDDEGSQVLQEWGGEVIVGPSLFNFHYFDISADGAMSFNSRTPGNNPFVNIAGSNDPWNRVVYGDAANTTWVAAGPNTDGSFNVTIDGHANDNFLKCDPDNIFIDHTLYLQTGVALPTTGCILVTLVAIPIP